MKNWESSDPQELEEDPPEILILLSSESRVVAFLKLDKCQELLGCDPPMIHH